MYVFSVRKSTGGFDKCFTTREYYLVMSLVASEWSSICTDLKSTNSHFSILNGYRVTGPGTSEKSLCMAKRVRLIMKF